MGNTFVELLGTMAHLQFHHLHDRDLNQSSRKPSILIVPERLSPALARAMHPIVHLLANTRLLGLVDPQSPSRRLGACALATFPAPDSELVPKSNSVRSYREALTRQLHRS
ncbi:unannotated protein [freshwater metagenome]|uniref:Unannotated protein n=1 Tax=freshwater metagenome TaxID=449393 RepID=A0A6J7SUX1_9ZZZZ